MTRPTLSSLPVEIQFHILKYVLYLSQECIGTSQPSSPNKQEDNQEIHYLWDWIEHDNGDISQFPYNAAAVCQLWLDILAKIPECWTRVIIDVASDPTRFLDIFLWSKDLLMLEVTIFNSHTPDAEDVEYSLIERERVSAIVDHLRPHASRCKFIAFNIAFLTSLPSPVVFLLEDALDFIELTLECKIDNAGPPEEYARICDLGVSDLIQNPSSFPIFNTLSLTGFWFMFVAGHPYTSEWFKAAVQSTASGYDVRIFINHFRFQDEGQYTVQNFVSYFPDLRPELVILSNLSLNRGHGSPILDRTKYEQSVVFDQAWMTLENVSPDVLQILFLVADVSPSYLNIVNCTFPDEALPSKASSLILSRIPYFSLGSNTKKNTSNTANIGSILRNWSGSSLVVSACPSFDDNTISALPETTTFEHLTVDDCGNVTVQGFQQFLKRRNRYSADTTPPPDYAPLRGIDVTSNDCPILSEEDKDWFMTSVYAKSTSISCARVQRGMAGIVHNNSENNYISKFSLP